MSRKHSKRVTSIQSQELGRRWKEVTDKESGKPYYYNAASGVTQWQMPTEAFGSASDSDATLRAQGLRVAIPRAQGGQ